MLASLSEKRTIENLEFDSTTNIINNSWCFAVVVSWESCNQAATTQDLGSCRKSLFFCEKCEKIVESERVVRLIRLWNVNILK